jgi:glycosyltransferase involved in cell wall biosynthesis
MLTIVIPTRNRQKYVPYAVKAALDRESDDIEVVVCDNSDDKEKIFSSLAEFATDARLKIVKSADSVLSMRANWERALDHASGTWVSFIGDDDLLDPNLIDFLRVIERTSPQTEVLTWEKPNYIWPDLRKPRNTVVAVSLGEECLNVVCSKMIEVLYSWNEIRNPGAGASIYHGAFSQNYIQRIKKKRGGIFFKYATVDFDAGYTAFFEAKNVAISRRPFSIVGASPDGNSAGVNSFSIQKKRNDEWLSDGNIYDGQLQKLPVSPQLSIAAIAYGFQIQFAEEYGIELLPPPEKIIRALEIDCAHEHEENMFYEKKSLILSALNSGSWSKYSYLFNPIYNSRFVENPIRGAYRGKLYVQHDINNSTNIYDFYRSVFWMLLSPKLVGQDFKIRIE